VLADAATAERGWRERVHAGLVAALEFLDEQPGWARLLILESAIAGGAICERRQGAVRALAGALERETRAVAAAEGPLPSAKRALTSSAKRALPSPATRALPSPAKRPLPSPAERSLAPSQLTAELVVGGVLAVIRTQMLERPERSLASLAPALMVFVERPYRNGDHAAESHAASSSCRVTYRTGRVLSAVGGAPRSNNRAIAEAAGVRDEGQTSKLLSRLERRGLIENVGLGAAYGEPNAWLLTRSGERALQDMRRGFKRAAGAKAAARIGGAA
jgi:hypothetical protein